jgi:hypothetical protein
MAGRRQGQGTLNDSAPAVPRGIAETASPVMPRTGYVRLPGGITDGSWTAAEARPTLITATNPGNHDIGARGLKTKRQSASGWIGDQIPHGPGGWPVVAAAGRMNTQQGAGRFRHFILAGSARPMAIPAGSSAPGRDCALRQREQRWRA